MTAWAAVAAAALAVLLAGPPRARLPTVTAPPPRGPARDWMHRFRPALSALGGCGIWVVLGGPTGVVLGLLGAVVVWTGIGRAESPAARRARAEIRRDLPHVVGLLASCLRSGSSPSSAVRAVCAALPGPASRRLSVVSHRLAVGVDPVRVWSDLADDPDLAPLGRALARSHETGASVVAAVDRLADELAQSTRARAEERARSIGVRAALPLGLCLLPAFLLVGIVPMVAGLLSTMSLG